MRIYGGGAVDDALVVAVPKASSGIGVPPIDIFEMTSDARLMWDREMSEDVNLESSSGVLSWGITSSSDILCWDASLDDPDSWPVVVFNRGRASWRRYECGMVKFIVGIFVESSTIFRLAKYRCGEMRVQGFSIGARRFGYSNLVSAPGLADPFLRSDAASFLWRPVAVPARVRHLSGSGNLWVTA